MRIGTWLKNIIRSTNTPCLRHIDPEQLIIVKTSPTFSKRTNPAKSQPKKTHNARKTIAINNTSRNNLYKNNQQRLSTVNYQHNLPQLLCERTTRSSSISEPKTSLLADLGFNPSELHSGYDYAEFESGSKPQGYDVENNDTRVIG